MNELFSFTITVFAKDEESLAFKDWYEKVFSTANPKMKDFEFTFSEQDGEEVIEVTSHNPNFPLNTLMNFFLSETDEHGCPDCLALNKEELGNNTNLN